MTGITIAAFGISGVGKTTLVAQLVSQHPFLLHVRAGQLLAMASNHTSTESLRLEQADIIRRNQETLATRFEMLRSNEPNRKIVFDGHVIVDNDTELVEVPLPVIRRLRPAVIVFVEDDPISIQVRREGDYARPRPSRTVAELEQQQIIARKLSADYGQQMGVPFERVTSGDLPTLEHVLRAYLVADLTQG